MPWLRCGVAGVVLEDEVKHALACVNLNALRETERTLRCVSENGLTALAPVRGARRWGLARAYSRALSRLMERSVSLSPRGAPRGFLPPTGFRGRGSHAP